LALIYFAVSLFVSAFLLFLVQPMIGKMILPRLGGTPQVWNTCMMFFQTVLLLGYAYTHNITSKLPTKKQLLAHCFVLLLPLPVLLAFGRPFSVAGFGAEGGGNPIFVTLALLTLIVGLPFLVVSTTAPLLQRWFHNTGHPAAKDPYFLYGASNLGSILGLILYPVLVERYLGLDAQAWFWLWGYILLAVLVAGCALMVMNAPPTVQLPGVGDVPAVEESPAEMPMPEPVESTAMTAAPPAPAVPRSTAIRRGGKRGGRGPRAPIVPSAIKGPTINIKKPPEPIQNEAERPYEVTPLRRLRWVGLAAVPTSLMLGTTFYISTDISPIPLLWIIPLTLYLLSFVLVFLRWPVPWVGVGRNPRGATIHKVMVVLQLAVIALLMFTLMRGGFQPLSAMLTCWGAFFLTALVCHGELARDRPPAQHLTEFYLWMSVGGMLGGTFNALIAPLVPWFGLFEFPLALVFAGLVRPPGPGRNWTDFLFEGMPKEQSDGLKYLLDFLLAALLLLFTWQVITQATEREGMLGWRLLYDPDRIADAAARNDKLNPLFRVMHKTLGLNPASAYTWTNILSLLLTFGLPIGLALLTWKRPLRLALCFGAVLLGNAIYEHNADERILYRDRSYFGILRVMQQVESYSSPKGDEGSRLAARATYLMHGTTHHGLNYQYPDGGGDTPDKDMRRLATTYYHRDCPVGVVMEAINWFPGYKTDTKDMRMTYWSDVHLPTSVIGSGAPGFGVNLPIAQIVSTWSEPPYACIGLGTGTMASYARPYQHMTFYEIDEHIRNFSLPPEDRETYFNYVQGALKRGSKLEIIMGDARLTMTKENESKDMSYYLPSFKDVTDRKARLKWNTFTSFPNRENYYRAMEVDAFSSDAIPVHLITKEAIELYMDKLMPNGVLCVHTSNRHVNLVLPVLKICEVAQWKDWLDRDENGAPKTKTGLAWVIGKDEGGESEGRGTDLSQPSENGHFRSEYVLVARKQEYLPPYTLTEKQMAEYKEIGAYAQTFTIKQQDDYTKFGLKTLPKQSHRQDMPFNSTIDFYGPDSYDDSKVNRVLRNGRSIMDVYGYVVTPGFRTWTDDYSNMLSVFRW
jgi:hypothetical protein